MKKIICLILALACALGCTVALASCGGGGDTVKDLFSIASSVSATRTVTNVEYETKDGVKLGGNYSLDVEGENSIFAYDYYRFRTVEESILENSDEKIKHVEGVVYYKDGKTSVNGAEWDSATPTPIDFKFNLKPELLKEHEVDEDGTHLLALIAKEKAAEVLGTDLNVEGDILIEVNTNGTYLTFVKVTYTTESGASVIIRTSYSYNKLALEFPENIGE